MFFISSERLDLVPLSYTQLLLLDKSRNELEIILGLGLTNFQFNSPYDFAGMFKASIHDHVIPAVKKHPQDFTWYTHWLIVNRSLKLTVGGIGASGLPQNGEVMIGYFTEKNAEGKGFATEAVRCFTSWIMENPNVHTVIADTVTDGFASQKVLQKTGFLFSGTTEEGLRWKLVR